MFSPVSVDIYTGIQVCLWTTSWRQFKSNCHQTSSIIPLTTGDEVVTFWKVKVGGGGMRCTERPSRLLQCECGVQNYGWRRTRCLGTTLLMSVQSLMVLLARTVNLSETSVNSLSLMMWITVNSCQTTRQVAADLLLYFSYTQLLFWQHWFCSCIYWQKWYNQVVLEKILTTFCCYLSVTR